MGFRQYGFPPIEKYRETLSDGNNYFQNKSQMQRWMKNKKISLLKKKTRLMYGAWAGLTCEYPQLSGQCQGLLVPSSDTPSGVMP
jgi:hypothetical protein